MKLLAENHVENKLVESNPEALEQIKTILTSILCGAVEKKIDWDARPMGNLKTNYTASVNVMNNAEWKTAKDILNGIIKLHPETDSEIKRVLGIIDPLGNF